MEFSFDPDDESELDDMFDGLKEKLILLDRKNLQTSLQSAEITQLVKEKSEACSELNQLKSTNQRLQVELNTAMKTSAASERQILELQAENARLESENMLLKTENGKLAATQSKITAESSYLKQKYDLTMEKVSTWQKVYEEVSQKQAQNQAEMLEVAKQIGQAKASTLYIHQLKQQVEVVYKNAFDTIKHLQESRGGLNSQKVKIDQDDGRIRFGEMDDRGSSDLNKPEQYWRNVNEKLKTEMQNYKEELWTGLRSLSQLTANEIQD